MQSAFLSSSTYLHANINLFQTYISTKEEMGLDEEKSYVCPLSIQHDFSFTCLLS